MERLTAVAVLLAVLGGQEASELHVQWVRSLPPRKAAWDLTPKMVRDTGYETAVAGGLVFIGCEYNGALLALDAATGEERWRFTTDDPIRVAPATDGERVFVGSQDGFLYALDLMGRLLWKFRGGPSERRILAHERLVSAWPISARPVVQEGRVYAVAGYWPIDGIFVHAIDAQRKSGLDDARWLSPRLHEGLFWEGIVQVAAHRPEKAREPFRRFMEVARTAARYKTLVKSAEKRVRALST